MLKNFICLKYKNIEFMISKEEVFTAVCSQPQSFINQETQNGLQRRFIFDSELLSYIDFDKIVETHFGISIPAEIRTAVIIKNTKIFEKEEYFALVTSASCRVNSIPLKNFSLFSNFYADAEKERGIIACRFENDSISYLINPNDFIQRTL